MRLACEEGMTVREKIAEEFAEIFGGGGDVSVCFAPGRVNLIGEHTDYNGGHVFPCALTLGIYGAARKRDDRKLRFYSANFAGDGLIESSLDDLRPNKSDGWADYPKGVLWAFGMGGYDIPSGFDMLVRGDIPNGSGLSSSAALEVLTGLIIKTLFPIDISMIGIARIGQYSENNFNGCNCGIMDQFASAMGKKDNAVFLDTVTLDYEYAPVVLDGAKLVITNSNVKHSLADSAYNRRRMECETALSQLRKVTDIETLGDLTEEEFEACKDAISSPVVRKRAKHAVYENRRTIRAVKALKAGDIGTFGQLMNESHISLRDDYEVSCEEVDILVDLAWRARGVIGSRITGGGFGGCTVSIVDADAVDGFISFVGEEYGKRTGREAEFYAVDIGDGAHVC